MRNPNGELPASRYAITDLYDETRRTFLVQYSTALFVALGLAGVVAFMLVGFLGYLDRAEPAFTQTVFHQPWPLFLWFCALIYALQVSILRNPRLRPRLLATMTVDVVSVTLVSLLYAFNTDVNVYLLRLLGSVQLFARGGFGDPLNTVLLVLASPWFAVAANVGVITSFSIGTGVRWRRRRSGQPPSRSSQGRALSSNLSIDLRTGSVLAYKGYIDTDDLPTLKELIVADLLVGATLVSVLAILFSGLVSWLNSRPLSFSCMVANITRCDGPTITVSSVDWLIVIIACLLSVGVVISAVVRDHLSGHAVGEGDQEEELPYSLRSTQEKTRQRARQVRLLVQNSLTCARDRLRVRHIRAASDNMAMSLRNVVWPVLVFFGTIAVATAAHYIQQYLHLLSDSKTCPGFPSAADCVIATQLLDNGQQYQDVALAVLWGVLAVLAIVFSATLLIFKWRVAENTLRFLGLIGFIVLLTFWLFSLALSGINEIFLLTKITNRVPFPQPEVTTIVSVSSLLIFGITLMFRRIRGPRGNQLPVTVEIGQR